MKPLQRTHSGNLPFACSGRLLSFRSMPGSTRLVIGSGGAPKPDPIPYSASSPDFPSEVVSAEVGTGFPEFDRNCVPGTYVIFAFGNSAFMPSNTLTTCVGLPL